MTKTASVTAGQRILALFFPHLPTDRLKRQRYGRSWRLPAMAGSRRGDTPLVIFAKQKGALRLTALDEHAEALGLKAGMGLADARAMHPNIEAVEADGQADHELLAGLADWCDRYTPLVATEPGGDGLYLDITGCAHLFGGEKALLDDILARLFDQGFAAHAALASTPGTAWAIARYGTQGIVEPGGEAQAMAPLPMAALRLSAAVQAGLDRLGLREAGALFSAPRAPLAKRFGTEIILRVDQALGRVEEPLSPRLPVPALSVERRLAEPVGSREDIEHMVFMLARTLRDGLERRGVGARALELVLFRVDGAVSRIALGTSRPLRDPLVMRRLFHERLGASGAELDAGYGFELVRLSVLADARLEAAQSDFSGDTTDEKESIAILADRIRARFDRPALLQPVERASHVPERAVQYVAFGGGAASAVAKGGGHGQAAMALCQPAAVRAERPLRLLRQAEPVEAVAEVPDGPPITFRWRRVLYRVARAEGPERIAPEWWHEDNGPPRDYFRVEDEAGHRYWLYRHGVYDNGERMPGWYMHGIFP